MRGGDWAASLAALERGGRRRGRPQPQPALRPAHQPGNGPPRTRPQRATPRPTSPGPPRSPRANGFADQEFKARHNLACLAFVDGDLARALVLMRAADRMDAAVSRDRARLDHAEVLLEAGLRRQGAQRPAGRAGVGTRRRAPAGGGGDQRSTGPLRPPRQRPGRRPSTHPNRAGRLPHPAGRRAGARRRTDPVDHRRRRRARPAARSSPTWHGATTSVATGTVADRAAVRLEAEARLLSGDIDGAERRLATLERTNRDSLAARLHETLVRARLDHARGRQVEAERRITTGNRLLAAHQFQSSSLDVRAALALHGRRLAAFDVERALARQDSDGILTSIERWRAISHRINPVTALDRPRAHRHDPRAPAAHGVSRPSARATPPASSSREIAQLEDHVAQREWTLTVGGTSAGTLPPVDADEARAATVRPGVHRRRVLRGGRRRCGPSSWTTATSTCRARARSHVVREQIARLRRDLRARVMVAAGSPMEAALAAGHRGVPGRRRRDAQPPRPGLGSSRDRRVVVIPSSTLAAVPWSLLPSLLGRPVTVAPSLTRWVRGPSRTSGAEWVTPVSALYGPGLARTGPEIRAIRSFWSADPVPR